MPKFEIFSHAVPSEVKISIFHSDIIASISVILDSERRCGTLAENSERINNHLYVTRRDIFVFAFSFAHTTFCLYTELTSQFISFFAELRIDGLIEHELCDTISVSQINESHATHFSGALHPSGQSDLIAGIGESQFSTSFRPIHNYIYNILLFRVQNYKFYLNIYDYLRKKHITMVKNLHKWNIIIKFAA